MRIFLKISIYFFLACLVFSVGMFLLDKKEVEVVKKEVEVLADTPPKSEQKEESLEKDIKNNRVILPVPYVSEAPEGNWSGDWVNACEEATITMVDGYYRGVKSVSVAEAKKYLQKLFDEENILYGSNKNTDASQMKELVDLYFAFGTEIKTNPTRADIKKEIDEGRPVISLHFGFDLQNKNIPFSPLLSSYHTIVIIGYDDEKGSFITHDPGDEKDGENLYYKYDVIMNSLHDYDKVRNKTDGVPTVLFTRKSK